MHHFHPQIGTIQDVLPTIHDRALCVQHTLIEVEAIQVKGHRANTQGSEPNGNLENNCPNWYVSWVQKLYMPKPGLDKDSGKLIAQTMPDILEIKC